MESKVITLVEEPPRQHKIQLIFSFVNLPFAYTCVDHIIRENILSDPKYTKSGGISLQAYLLKPKKGAQVWTIFLNWGESVLVTDFAKTLEQRLRGTFQQCYGITMSSDDIAVEATDDFMQLSFQPSRVGDGIIVNWLPAFYNEEIFLEIKTRGWPKVKTAASNLKMHMGLPWSWFSKYNPLSGSGVASRSTTPILEGH